MQLEVEKLVSRYKVTSKISSQLEVVSAAVVSIGLARVEGTKPTIKMESRNKSGN